MGPMVHEQTGKASAREPRLVLASEWITAPRNLSGDEALAELAARYVRGRGAVRVQDFAWWTMLPAARAKLGLRLASEAGRIKRAKRADVAGVAGELWVSPESLEASVALSGLDRAAGAKLQALPAFDEHLLGYRFREPQLPDGYFDYIVPGRNGVFKATVVQDGRVVATWRYVANTGGVEVTPLPGRALDLDALNPELQRWATFAGKSLAEVTFV